MKNFLNKKYNFLRAYIPDILKSITKVFLYAIIAVLFLGIYGLGLFQGFLFGVKYVKEDYISLFNYSELKISPTITSTPTPTLSLKQTITPKPQLPQKITWGGPELWESVNKKRIELGVNPLIKKDELCTIASIRLNELLELGKLDGHEGFSNMQDRRSDLKWIFEKYSTIAEFLAVGGKTPDETVNLWLNTLGHQKLLNGGEFVWGCIYAQNSFAVAITAY